MIKDYLEHQFSFKQDDVELFAKCTGDDNPIHLDEEFASKSIFKKRILHGFLSASIFSKIFGTISPGEGTLYLSQTMFFLKPMFTETTYMAKVQLLTWDNAKGRGTYSTLISDPLDTLVFKGEATVFHENFKAYGEL